ncbi:uncharacterized protein LOC117330802 [Pecten maximus]|uniref:uncharacterized protein LOC117330802 n=1 Tax=Pecten maximus TaxID=6579 RepID=UPI0014589F2C|nr:uncharacterized protein LOC117330802 [Pecten maximus]
MSNRRQLQVNMDFTKTCKNTVKGLLNVLVFALPFLALTNQQMMAEVPLDGRELPIYKDMFSSTLPTIYRCIELCWAYKLCKSLAYSKSQQLCVLKNSDDLTWTVIIVDTVMLTRQKLPQLIAGNCQNHDCKIDEKCVSTPTGFSCVKHELTTVRCPWETVQHHDKCIWVVRRKITWNEAKNVCGKGAFLAEIHSEDFAWFIQLAIEIMCQHYSICNFPRSFWFGLKYSREQSALVWNHSGKVLTSTDVHKFRSYPPTMNGTLCVGMHEERYRVRHWAPMDCEEKNLVVCQLTAPQYWT